MQATISAGINVNDDQLMTENLEQGCDKPKYVMTAVFRGK